MSRSCPTLLLAVLHGAMLIGCVGTLEEKYPAELSNGADAGPPLACDEPATSGHDGHHNPGTACMDCHKAGGTGPLFTVGGTIYTDLTGAAAITDATVRVVDATGADFALPVAANGNFWSTDAMEFPVHTFASRCPDMRDMVSPLDQSGGNCNQGGCHSGGFRVWMP